MIDGRSSGGTFVFEDQPMHQPPILLQVHQSVSIDPQDFADIFQRQPRHALFIMRAFDDHFMCPNAVHQVIDAVAPFAQLTFHLQCGKLVRDHANSPTRRVALRTGIAISEDLVRSRTLVPFEERIKSLLTTGTIFLANEVVRPLRAIGRDNDPAANDRVFAEIWHDGGVWWRER